jgi:hypothetical protein
VQISNFDDLLLAAREQALPQRMLFVFMKTTLQKDATIEQRAGFDAGVGGALMPLFCVDLTPDETESLSALTIEGDKQSTDWDKVLVACMDDAPNQPGAKDRVDQALRLMVAKVEGGGPLSGYLCFTRTGEPVLFG